MENLYIQSQKELTAAVALLAETLKSGAIDLSYRLHKRDKTREQLGYYYGCVLPLIRKRMKQDGNNYTIDEIDNLLKVKLFSEVRYNPFSKQLDTIVKMKRNATIKEMSEYLELVINFCEQDLGIKIPASEDYIIIKEIGL